MKTLRQSPRDPDFIQNPYLFYDHARAQGHLVFWQDYDMAAAFGHREVTALLRDRRLGREIPHDRRQPTPDHLRAFQAVEDNSLLESEPPRHTRLRALVLRAFTSRRVAGMAPAIRRLCHDLIDGFPSAPFDLIPAYCTQIPVITIARLLGLPDGMSPQLLDWSHRMVAMYQAGRSRETEERANAAAEAFSVCLDSHIAARRLRPGDDLMSALIQAEERDAGLSARELTATLILLLNAGHEATVHSLGNGVKCLLQQGWQPDWFADGGIAALVEEVLRFDPPLHMFTRYAYEDMTLFGCDIARGDQVALMLGAANRDPAIWRDPHRFDPARPMRPHLALGGGIHFCVGAPLARLEMQIALQVLFERCPRLRLDAPPAYGDTYHFHGLTRLTVAA